MYGNLYRSTCRHHDGASADSAVEKTAIGMAILEYDTLLFWKGHLSIFFPAVKFSIACTADYRATSPSPTRLQLHALEVQSDIADAAHHHSYYPNI